MTSLPRTKEAARRIALTKRDAIMPAEREANALLMRDRFLQSVPLPKKAAVSAYIPYRSEINGLPLAEALIARGHQMLMPRTAEAGLALEFRTWTPQTPLHRTPVGIMEPDPRHSSARIPDVLIMPVLAFDGAGRRLGYGAGFFDHTFSQWRGKIPYMTVGIAHQAQFFDEVPVEAHDQMLDFCITNENTYQFRDPADIWWV